MSINDEWLNYSIRQLKKNISSITLKEKLEKENYHEKIIETILVNYNNFEELKNKLNCLFEEKVEEKVEKKIDNFHNTFSDNDFIESTIWQGTHEGYVFKKDSKGMGYYKDTLNIKPKIKKMMNKSWVDYVTRQIGRGVDKKALEDILRKENYSDELINKYVYQKIDNSYSNYVLQKMNSIKLNSQEQKLYEFLKNQHDLEKQIKEKRILIIDNWLEESVATYIYDLFHKSKFAEGKKNANNTLSFKFSNVVKTPEIEKFFFLFNNLFQHKYLFNGCIGMSKYTKGSFIDEHTDHGGYIHNDKKYYRSISCVLYFNKDWKEEYGGCFIDIENNKKILPKFNRAVFFSVPYKHRVEEIIAENKDRHAIFMFFTENRILYFLNENRFNKTSSLI